MNDLATARHLVNMAAWAISRHTDKTLAGATAKLSSDALRLAEGIDRICPAQQEQKEDPTRYLSAAERWIYNYLVGARRLVSVGEGTAEARLSFGRVGKNWFRRNARRLVERGMATNPRHGMYTNLEVDE